MKGFEIMKVTRDISLKDFDFWSGAKDTVNQLSDSELDTIESVLEDEYPDGIDETTLNDIFWFEDEFISDIIGRNIYESVSRRSRSISRRGVRESRNSRSRRMRRR